MQKQNICIVVNISRKERRERKGLISLLLTLALEWSQVSLRLESAEVGWQTNIVYNSCMPLRPLVVRSQRLLKRKCCLINSLRSLRALRAERKHPGGGYYCLTQRAQRARRFNFPHCSRWRWRSRKHTLRQENAETEWQTYILYSY